jgi:hypothetical protein
LPLRSSLGAGTFSLGSSLCNVLFREELPVSLSLLSSPEIARAEDSDEPALDESAELAAPGAAIPN